MAEKEKAKLTRRTLVSGSWHDAGDTVEVYPFQKRHLVDGGYCDGGVEEIASDGEKRAGALNVLKKPAERDDIDPWSVERAFDENDVGVEKPAPKGK